MEDIFERNCKTLEDSGLTSLVIQYNGREKRWEISFFVEVATGGYTPNVVVSAVTLRAAVMKAGTVARHIHDHIMGIREVEAQVKLDLDLLDTMINKLKAGYRMFLKPSESEMYAGGQYGNYSDKG